METANNNQKNRTKPPRRDGRGGQQRRGNGNVHSKESKDHHQHENHQHTHHERSVLPKPQMPTPTKNPLASSTSSMTSNSEEACHICLDPVEFYALGKCNHREQCSQCYIRRRVLYNQKECPLCRQPVERVVFTDDKEKPFESFDLSSYTFNEEYGIYIKGESEEHFKNFSRLWKMQCPYCDQSDFSDVNQLRAHAKEKHNLQFCDVCIEERKVFLQEQKFYSPRDLKEHLKTGDKDTQIAHALCQFCNKYFFDSDKLYEHLYKDHESCFLCTKQGKQFEYYKNYAALEEHFRRQHYLCEHPECLEKHFIVFSSKEALKVHEVQAHIAKQNKKSAKISLEFNVNRHHHHHSRGDDSNENSQPVPPPDVSKAEEFPSLAQDANSTTSTTTSSSTGQPPVMPTINYAAQAQNWNAKIQPLAAQNFPALSSESSTTTPHYLQSATWGAPKPIATKNSSSPSSVTTLSSSSGQQHQQQQSGRSSDFPSFPSSTASNKQFNPNWGRDSGEHSNEQAVLSNSLFQRSTNSNNTNWNVQNRNTSRAPDLTADFPTLGGKSTAAPQTSSTWGSNNNNKKKSTLAAPAPAPAKPASLNEGESWQQPKGKKTEESNFVFLGGLPLQGKKGKK